MSTKTLAFVVFLSLAFSPLVAKAQASAGNITGVASTGDTILITGDGIGFKRELKIEKDGKYQVRGVPPGNYTVVRVHGSGAVDPAQSIVVRAGSTGRVNLPESDSHPAEDKGGNPQQSPR